MGRNWKVGERALYNGSIGGPPRPEHEEEGVIELIDRSSDTPYCVRLKSGKVLYIKYSSLKVIPGEKPVKTKDKAPPETGDKEPDAPSTDDEEENEEETEAEQEKEQESEATNDTTQEKEDGSDAGEEAGIEPPPEDAGDSSIPA